MFVLFREVFQKGGYEAYFQISVGNQPLFDESTFKLWLNGQQYHTDKETLRGKDLSSYFKVRMPEVI